MEQTDSCQRGGRRGTVGKKGKGVAKEHTCTAHRHRRGVVRAGQGLGGGGQSEGKGGHL